MSIKTITDGDIEEDQSQTGAENEKDSVASRRLKFQSYNKLSAEPNRLRSLRNNHVVQDRKIFPWSYVSSKIIEENNESDNSNNSDSKSNSEIEINKLEIICKNHLGADNTHVNINIEINANENHKK